MTQAERRIYLIKELLKERSEYGGLKIPGGEQEQKRLLRSLWNIRMPLPVSEEFLAVQDAYLREETARKGITHWKDTERADGDIYLWRGDITTLECDAIVNAANSQMLGCFIPCHGCIDNAIHTFAGIQLRAACARLMKEQNSPEPVGKAKITPALNLPSRFVLHTVGPMVQGRPTEKACELLASCYWSCLELAEKHGLTSVAFCCISTGEFHFPNDQAARVAVDTVKKYLAQAQSGIKVIFNVYQKLDESIYRKLLCGAGKTGE